MCFLVFVMLYFVVICFGCGTVFCFVVSYCIWCVILSWCVALCFDVSYCFSVCRVYFGV